jgi:hypothetical protein
VLLVTRPLLHQARAHRAPFHRRLARNVLLLYYVEATYVQHPDTDSHSPIRAQYLGVKRQHANALLFFLALGHSTLNVAE